MIEASLKDVVPTTQLHTEMPDWTQGTCELTPRLYPAFRSPSACLVSISIDAMKCARG
jgi:hypothetical protein